MNDDQPPPLTGGIHGNGGDSSFYLEDAFELLSEYRRRVVLASLRDRKGEWVSLEWLVEQVASTRPDAGSRSPGLDEETRRIAVSLHHTHLPKLADAGVLTYDTYERICQYHGVDALEALLDAIDRDETW